MNAIRIWNKLFNKNNRQKKTYNTKYIKSIPVGNFPQYSTSNTTATSNTEYPPYIHVKYLCYECNKILGHYNISEYDALHDFGKDSFSKRDKNNVLKIRSDLTCPTCHILKKLKE